MVTQIVDELLVLAGSCDATPHAVANGWTIDSWTITDEVLAALADLYDKLLTGDLEEEIADALGELGVDVEELLIADDQAVDKITRADLTELLAAAAAIGADGWPIETMHLPNVPKGSRKRSEVGIDAMATTLDFASTATTLADDERLLIASVKHSVDNPSDLRYKLVMSISEAALTPTYLAQQLRVFQGRLKERGMDAPRIWLFLGDHLNPNIDITLVGAVDAGDAAGFSAQMANLPTASGGGLRHCRHLLIAAIADLQDNV